MRCPSLFQRALFFLIPLSVLVTATERGAAGDPAPPLSRCLEQMQDKNWQKRLSAAESVGCWGTAGKPAISALIAMLNEKDLRLQEQAAKSLAQIGPAALPALKPALQDKRPSVRYWAANALRCMGPDAKEGTPDLFEMAEDQHIFVRTNVLQALIAIDRDAKEVEELVERVSRQDKRLWLRTLAEVWLQRLRTQEEKQKALNPFFTPTPPLSRAQQRLLEQEVMGFLYSETRHSVPQRTPSIFSAHALLYQGGSEIIPALVKGVNYGITAQASCPFSTLTGRLTTLVRNCSDPKMLDYVLLHLGRGVEIPQMKTNYFIQHALGIKEACLKRKAELALLAGMAQRHKELVTERWSRSDKEIKDDFKNSDAGIRFAALCIAAERHLRCEDEYIDLLTDSEVWIVQMARQTLVGLARGTDFGPPAKAAPDFCLAAQQRWRDWWQYQDSNPKAIKLPAESRTSKLVTSSPPSSEADRLGTALVKAEPARRPALLKKLQLSKGVEYTDALATAIPHLQGDDHKKGREALADRLTRMTARTLRDKLTDEDVEVRRAAALAVAMKEDHELIPDLIPLLKDDEMTVMHAAKAALRSLTGENFGPDDDTDSKGRIEVIKKWRAWWAEHEEH
ncbi:MAG TPA: HEAT repeat domain-containing protein [Gemmataceae bacterium]|jgi:HEAT repeat protein